MFLSTALPSQKMDSKEFSIVCAVLSRKVESIALAKLVSHGYYGIDCSIDAPNTFDALCVAYANKGKLFPVYSEGNDQTIYSTPVVNMLARAWHDLIHIELNAEFTLAGESLVADQQSNNDIFTTLEKEILLHEVVSQVKYNIKNGFFPVNQKQFVLDCINLGYNDASLIHSV